MIMTMYWCHGGHLEQVIFKKLFVDSEVQSSYLFYIKIFPFLFSGLSQYTAEHLHISRPALYTTHTRAYIDTRAHIYTYH